MKNSSTMFCVSLFPVLSFQGTNKLFSEVEFFLLLPAICEASRFFTSLPTPFIIFFKFLMFLNCVHVHVNIYLTTQIELACRGLFWGERFESLFYHLVLGIKVRWSGLAASVFTLSYLTLIVNNFNPLSIMAYSLIYCSIFASILLRCIGDIGG